MEAVLATALLGVVTLMAATVMINISTANKGSSVQLANVDLANVIRLQLSRRSPADPTTACTTNLVGRPGAYAGTAPIAVQLGSGGPVVQAGVPLNDWKLNVQSLEVRNITSAGLTNGTNNLYFGDVFMTTQSQDPNSVQLRETAVARLAMEVQGGTNLISCYANDLDEDTSQQLATLCGLMRSPTGGTGAWDGTRCLVTDSTPPTTCANIGGTYAAGACAFHSETFVISRTIPPGMPGGGVGYTISCPAGTLTVGGACSAVGYYGTPFATLLLYGPIASQPGLFDCAWLPGDYPGGNESVPYNLYAVCLK